MAQFKKDLIEEIIAYYHIGEIREDKKTNKQLKYTSFINLMKSNKPTSLDDFIKSFPENI